MKARDIPFVAWVTFISACAAFGAFVFAMGVGLGPELGIVIMMTVLISTFFLVDRPHQS
jgi:hypothetical protein